MLSTKRLPILTLRGLSTRSSFRSNILIRSLATFKPAEPLSIHDVNQNTVEAKYAVRGKSHYC